MRRKIPILGEREVSQVGGKISQAALLQKEREQCMNKTSIKP